MERNRNDDIVDYWPVFIHVNFISYNLYKKNFQPIICYVDKWIDYLTESIG